MVTLYFPRSVDVLQMPSYIKKKKWNVFSALTVRATFNQYLTSLLTSTQNRNLSLTLSSPHMLELVKV